MKSFFVPLFAILCIAHPVLADPDFVITERYFDLVEKIIIEANRTKCFFSLERLLKSLSKKTIRETLAYLSWKAESIQKDARECLKVPCHDIPEEAVIALEEELKIARPLIIAMNQPNFLSCLKKINIDNSWRESTPDFDMEISYEESIKIGEAFGLSEELKPFERFGPY